MNKNTRNKKVNYILKNSFLLSDQVSKYDDYEVNIIYNNIKAGAIYGITE